MGFEKLWDFIQSILGLFQFWEVLDEYESGVVFTLGRPRRAEHVIGPGLHWLLPFGVEKVVSYNTGLNCNAFQAQTITTKDGRSVSVTPNCIWKVRDVYKLAVEVEDDEQVMYSHVRMLVADTVRDSTWADMTDPEWHKRLTGLARKAGFKYGIEIEKLGLSDIVCLDFAGRLIQDYERV